MSFYCPTAGGVIEIAVLEKRDEIASLLVFVSFDDPLGIEGLGQLAVESPTKIDVAETGALGFAASCPRDVCLSAVYPAPLVYPGKHCAPYAGGLGLVDIVHKVDVGREGSVAFGSRLVLRFIWSSG
jgi:hypothetical protein